MRRVAEFVWDEENIDHLGRHGVHPEEVEEACYHRPYVLKGKGRSYLILGRTNDGRYLLVVLRYQGKGLARTVTARDMTEAEKRFYQKRR